MTEQRSLSMVISVLALWVCTEQRFMCMYFSIETSVLSCFPHCVLEARLQQERPACSSRYPRTMAVVFVLPANYLPGIQLLFLNSLEAASKASCVDLFLVFRYAVDTSYLFARRNAGTPVRRHSGTHARRHARKHARTHARTHAHTHTHTHTHTHPREH